MTKLSDITGHVTKIEVPIGTNGQTFQAGVLSGKLTPQFLRDVARLEGSITSEEEFDELLGLYAEVIDSWELEDDDGNQIPPTVDNLNDVPVRILGRIIDAAVEGKDIREEGKG